MSIESVRKNTNEALPSQIEFVGGAEESEQFPGSKIFTVKEGDRFFRYALQKGPDGSLQGTKFEVQEYKVLSGTGGAGVWDSSEAHIRVLEGDDKVGPEGSTQPKFRIGAKYQLHEDKLTELESALKEKGIEI